MGLLQSAMIAMIKPDPHETAIGGGRLGEPASSAARRAAGFSIRTCLPAATAPWAISASVSCKVEMMTMETAGSLTASFQSVTALQPGHRRCQPIGPILGDVGTDHQTRAAKRLRALLADQAATDDRHTRSTAHRSPHCLFRSRPVIRRNV